MKKMLVIMNPYAGTRQAARFLAETLDIFCRADFDVTVAMTQGQGDGKKIAEERGGDKDIVVAVGGDGTFNEVIAGVMNKGYKVKIGYIPAGTTNDFAQSVGLNKTVVPAAETIVGGNSRQLDIGRYNGRFFSYVASFGAFASTSYDAPQDLKNMIGHAAYILSGLKDVVNIKPLKLSVKSEDHVYEGDFIFGAVCNSTSMGGVINLKQSDVDMNDGVFEVMLIKSPKNIFELNEIIIAVTTQSYSDCSMITFFSSARVEIEAPEDMPWTLDGEYQKGSKKIVIENVKSAIEIMVPESRPENNEEDADPDDNGKDKGLGIEEPGNGSGLLP